MSPTTFLPQKKNNICVCVRTPTCTTVVQALTDEHPEKVAKSHLRGDPTHLCKDYIGNGNLLYMHLALPFQGCSSREAPTKNRH